MMGNTFCPRPIYDNGFVMNFYVKEKEVYYKILKWNEDGTLYASIESGKLGKQDPKDVLNNFKSQLFSTVSKN